MTFTVLYRLPYSDLAINSLQLGAEVARGLRPSDILPSSPFAEDVQKLMRSCWADDPDMRPSFALITAALETISANPSMQDAQSFDKQWASEQRTV